jgi:hypothetical protein
MQAREVSQLPSQPVTQLQLHGALRSAKCYDWHPMALLNQGLGAQIAHYNYSYDLLEGEQGGYIFGFGTVCD